VQAGSDRVAWYDPHVAEPETGKLAGYDELADALARHAQQLGRIGESNQVGRDATKSLGVLQGLQPLVDAERGWLD
jgi:hypothetical protein